MVPGPGYRKHPTLLPALNIALQKLQLSALTVGKLTAGNAANRQIIALPDFFQLIQTPLGSPHEMAKYIFLEKIGILKMLGRH